MTIFFFFFIVQLNKIKVQVVGRWIVQPKKQADCICAWQSLKNNSTYNWEFSLHLPLRQLNCVSTSDHDPEFLHVIFAVVTLLYSGWYPGWHCRIRTLPANVSPVAISTPVIGEGAPQSKRDIRYIHLMVQLEGLWSIRTLDV